MVSLARNSGGPEGRPYFDPRITLGNILTIVGAVIFGGIFLAVLNTRLNTIELAVTDIRCTLAYAGIAPTTGACVLPAPRTSMPH